MGSVGGPWVGLANSQKFLSQPALFVTALASSNTAEIALAPRSVIASTAVAGKSTFLTQFNSKSLHRHIDFAGHALPPQLDR